MVIALPESIGALLRERAAAARHQPLLTFVSATHDERTELSYATFTNWVGKTANLLSEEFDVEPGDRVGLALPTSWIGAVLAMACWTLRACAVPAPLGASDRLRVVVIGERAGAGTRWPHDAARMVVGDGMAGRLLGPGVPGALPYGEEVLAHADDAEDTGPALDDDALLLATGPGGGGPPPLSQRDLLAAAGAAGLVPGARLLSTLPLDHAEGLAIGLLGPLAGQGAVVLVAGRPDAMALIRLAREERVATLLTDAAGVVALATGDEVGGLTRILSPGGAPIDAVERLARAGAAVTVPPAIVRGDPGVGGP